MVTIPFTLVDSFTKICAKESNMRIVGIDPGSLHLGWGVIEAQGTRIKAIDYGTIDLPSSMALSDRLVQIDLKLAVILSDYKPETASIETLFFAKNVQSAVKLGHARGVILLALAKAGLPIFEYEPRLVKRTVVGSGAADKAQVARVIQSLLGLPELPRTDEADALAIAITHSRASHLQSYLQKNREASSVRKTR